MQKVLYQKEVSCPVCNSKFKTSKVRLSQCRVERRDEDFCTYYEGENPLFYNVWVCPQCGYSALENSFYELNAWQKANVGKHISTKWVKKSYGSKRGIKEALECYKLALYCGQVIDEKDSLIASICLCLSWLYRMQGNTVQERKFMEHAIGFYTEAYQKETFPIGKMNEPTLMYLIGELYRRIDKCTEAVKWFNRVVRHPLRHETPAVEKMARDQWHLASQQRKENGEYNISVEG
ncbi:MAG TPA: DUF2225 domain-containing protein [Thermoanaerobacterales bacterium]|nr:DUF2225 domain-containing protein [Thermoanaerobacterales bacterium]